MSFLTRSIRIAPRTAFLPSKAALSTSVPRFATGYGDTNPEQASGKGTPTPASTPDPKPDGQGNKAGEKSGTTDPEVGGEKGPHGKDVKETKKIGEEPKKEEVGSAGPIGG